MMGSMTWFLIAVGAASAVCFALMSRADRARGRQASSDGGSSYDPGIPSSGDGWSLTNWFGSTHSGQSTDTSGGGDSGGAWSGGSDSGGGGGDGGGGGGSSD